MPRKSLTIVATLLLALPLLTGLGTPSTALAQDATPLAATPDTSISGSIDVGMVANPQMVALQDLVNAGEFNKAYPNIKVNLTVLPENEIRQTITQDVTTQAGKFDAVTVGPFEVPMWAKQGWLAEVGKDVAADPNYDLKDVFPSMLAGLTYEDGIYALPFYGESAMTYYRKDLFDAAGIEMPERPTWDQIQEYAAKLNGNGVYGVCLRGLPGWGEQLAPLTTVINAFGGRWYDMDWKAQLSAPKSAAAIKFYIELLQKYGPPGAEQNGFTENETLFIQGKCAMWYDATSAADFMASSKTNPNYADKMGYAYGPSEELKTGNWLWSWNFAMEANTDAPEATLAFMKWATSKDYDSLIVAHDGGWGRAPTGARMSTYKNEDYLKTAAPFADIVLNSIEEANPNKPTADPVPYTGGQFVRIPEFQQLGNDVSKEFAAAIVGQESIDDAIQKANDLANQVAVEGGYQT
ncbi:MAG TPA: sugar ABC transporter substrate-binding protein [Thermomicrobiales bacterium]|nr:sugar ABC transporter substrate-binding protein [Thermomicrobiales bacterium]